MTFEVLHPFTSTFYKKEERQYVQYCRMLSTVQKKPLSTHPIFDIVRKQKQEMIARALGKKT